MLFLAITLKGNFIFTVSVSEAHASTLSDFGCHYCGKIMYVLKLALSPCNCLVRKTECYCVKHFAVVFPHCLEYYSYHRIFWQMQASYVIKL